MVSPVEESTLNIYVGCEPPQHVAARVLEHSILRHASIPVAVHRLDECVARHRLPVSGRTMFSLQRFFIPEINGFKGLAVYIDSDMLVFDDVRDLIAHRAPGVAVSSAETPPGSGRKRQFSVMVIDCELARWKPQEIHQKAQSNYRDVMYELSFEPSKTVSLPYTWNSLERYEAGKTQLLHYTDMNLQPWVDARNPLLPVWMDALFAALDDGFVTMDEVAESTRRGWLRPGVLWQAKHREREVSRLPLHLKIAEAFYRAPHKPRYWARKVEQVRHGGAKLVGALNGGRVPRT